MIVQSKLSNRNPTLGHFTRNSHGRQTFHLSATSEQEMVKQFRGQSVSGEISEPVPELGIAAICESQENFQNPKTKIRRKI